MPLGLMLSTVGVAVGVTVMAVFGHYAARPGLGARGAARRGDRADRLGRGVLGAAAGAAARLRPRNAGGGVRAQRRPHAAAGHAGQHRRGRRPRVVRAARPDRRRAGASAAAIGCRAGRRSGRWLLTRSALPVVGPVPAGRARRLRGRVRAARRSLHASGFAAVYVAALVLGNADLPHRRATRSFAEGVGWLAQIGLFVMLGLLLSPGRLTWWHVGAGAARRRGADLRGQAAVGGWRRRLPLRVPWREQAFLSWAGLRGAVPIVLATIPLAEDVPGADRPVRPGGGAGRRLHARPGTRPWPAWPSWLGLSTEGRAAGPRGRGRAAGPDGRRPAARARARDRACTASRSVSCGCPPGASISLVVRAGTSFGAVGAYPAAARRRAAGRGSAAGPQRHRGAAAGGGPARPAGRLEDRRGRGAGDAVSRRGRVGRLVAARRSPACRRAPCDPWGLPLQAEVAVADERRRRPRRRGRAGRGPGPCPGTGCVPAVPRPRSARCRRPSRAATSTRRGALAASPRRKPRSARSSQRRRGQVVAGAGVVDVDHDLVAVQPAAGARWSRPRRRRSCSANGFSNGSSNCDQPYQPAPTTTNSSAASVIGVRRLTADARLDRVDPRVQHVALLQGRAQRAVQAVLEVELAPATARRGRTGRRRTSTRRRAGWPGRGCAWW